MAAEDKKVWYEVHPVSVERKKELVNAGFRIYDAQFAPEDWKPDEEQAEKDKKAAQEAKKKPGKDAD